MAERNPLASYRSKRDFSITPEPSGAHAARGKGRFVVQKHAAKRLHYDLRLELDGTYKSWAVPKGPSLDPADRRIAVHVEDHPLEYGEFEGVIPEKQYGAGTVIVWDRGTWTPLGDAAKDYAAGKLKFSLHGHKLRGGWTLVRMKPKAGEKKNLWLLIKERDAEARSAASFDVTEALPDSVSSATKRRPSTTARSPARKSTARTSSPGSPKGARRAALPLALAPQLATLVDAPPKDGNIEYEAKFDGYRMLARVDGDDVRLFTRNGHDWTSRLPHLKQALKRLGLGSAWIDGEIVMPGKNGRIEFQALQNAFEAGSTAGIHYYVFDLPFYQGEDWRGVPLVERRRRLQALIPDEPKGPIRFSESFGSDAPHLLRAVAQLGLEGLIGKQVDSRYVSGRSTSWIKLKPSQRQEFVIVGYTDPRGTRSAFGALLLGVHAEDGALKYAGRVGTGFSEATLATLSERLSSLRVNRSPLQDTPKGVNAHWVKPTLVAEVSFSQWTEDGVIRHPVFRGLRQGVEPTRVAREIPARLPSTFARKRSTGTIAVTHGDRVIDRTTGLTKLALFEYYQAAAGHLLAHLKGRPTAIVRAPAGVEGQIFFQKRAETLTSDGIEEVDSSGIGGHQPMLQFSTETAIVYGSQMNVIEFHTGNATLRNLDRPDRVVFDLDPGQGVAFERVAEGALLTRTVLDELGLVSFLKTSGGKGLHLVVPLLPRFDWDAVKEFSEAVVAHLARTLPDRFVNRSGARNRLRRIYIDVGRNARGATTVAAYSARARAGLGVSMPVTWDELATLKSADQWNIVTAVPRLQANPPAWKDYAGTRQALGAAMRALGIRSKTVGR